MAFSQEERIGRYQSGDFLSLLEQSNGTSSNTRCVSVRAWRCNKAIVSELAQLLLANPAGLRRWTVMRGMRKAWENAAREVSQKFEDEVERNFRCFSEDDERAKSAGLQPEDALFYRPRDKAGEVWAAHADRAHAWLAASAPKKE
jgi:hypothetical protein